MADIELVIRISKEDFEIMKHNIAINNPLCPLSQEEMVSKVANGIPLPKGHGRIMDVDKVIKKMEEREEQLKDDRSIWETAAVETALDMFGDTIIEADKAGK